MAGENKLLILGAMFAVTVIGKAELMDIKNEDTIMFLEESNKETNDDLFVEFVDGKTAQKPDKSIDLVAQTNIKTKKNKPDKNKYIALEQDGYGVLAENLEELDEDYIASSQVFQLTGIDDSLEPFNRRMYAFNPIFLATSVTPNNPAVEFTTNLPSAFAAFPGFNCKTEFTNVGISLKLL